MNHRHQNYPSLSLVQDLLSFLQLPEELLPSSILRLQRPQLEVHLLVLRVQPQTRSPPRLRFDPSPSFRSILLLEIAHRQLLRPVAIQYHFSAGWPWPVQVTFRPKEIHLVKELEREFSLAGVYLVVVSSSFVPL